MLFSSEMYDGGQPFAHHHPMPPSAAAQCEDADSACAQPLPAHDTRPRAHSGWRASAQIAAGHLTNLARNSSGLVWGLDRLEVALGAAAFAALWAQLQRHTAEVLSAAQGALQEAHAWLRWVLRHGTHMRTHACACTGTLVQAYTHIHTHTNTRHTTRACACVGKHT